MTLSVALNGPRMLTAYRASEGGVCEDLSIQIISERHAA